MVNKTVQKTVDDDMVDTVGDDAAVVAVEKHPRAIRWMHWLNFPILSIMIWSGLRIYWAFDFRQPRFNEDRLLPESVWQLFDLDRSLANGMAFHFTFGWLFVINGALYVGYLAISGEWRTIVPRRSALREIPATLRHELRPNSAAPPPAGDRTYNVMQQLAYTMVVVMGAVVVATGFAIFKPTQLAWLTNLFGGYESARTIHFLTTAGFVGFFVIHLVQVARAGFENFWSMVTGFELTTRPAAPTSIDDEGSEVSR